MNKATTLCKSEKTNVEVIYLFFTSNVNSYLIVQLQHFRYQIDHSNIDISCGLFTVDWTLFYTVKLTFQSLRKNVYKNITLFSGLSSYWIVPTVVHTIWFNFEQLSNSYCYINYKTKKLFSLFGHFSCLCFCMSCGETILSKHFPFSNLSFGVSQHKVGNLKNRSKCDLDNIPFKTGNLIPNRSSTNSTGVQVWLFSWYVAFPYLLKNYKSTTSVMLFYKFTFNLALIKVHKRNVKKKKILSVF